jgi:hypothetical protein
MFDAKSSIAEDQAFQRIMAGNFLKHLLLICYWRIVSRFSRFSRNFQFPFLGFLAFFSNSIT